MRGLSFPPSSPSQQLFKRAGKFLFLFHEKKIKKIVGIYGTEIEIKADQPPFKRQKIDGWLFIIEKNRWKRRAIPSAECIYIANPFKRRAMLRMTCTGEIVEVIDNLYLLHIVQRRFWCVLWNMSFLFGIPCQQTNFYKFKLYWNIFKKK